MSRLSEGYQSTPVDSDLQRALRWAIAGVLLLLTSLLLGMVASGATIVPGDLQISIAIQLPRSMLLDAIAHAASAIGDTFPGMVVVAAMVAILLLTRGRRDLALVIALAAALRALTPALKLLAASPRPPDEALVILAQADGFGYPSGHALGVALLYGAIAIVAPETVNNRPLARAVQLISVAMIALIAWSRVRLGVHWPSDVVGGILVGLGLVALLYAALLNWRSRTART